MKCKESSDHKVKLLKISGRLSSVVIEGNSLAFQREIFSLYMCIIYICMRMLNMYHIYKI